MKMHTFALHTCICVHNGWQLRKMTCRCMHYICQCMHDVMLNALICKVNACICEHDACRICIRNTCGWMHMQMHTWHQWQFLQTITLQMIMKSHSAQNCGWLNILTNIWFVAVTDIVSKCKAMLTKQSITMSTVCWTILYGVHQCIIPHPHYYIPMNTAGFLWSYQISMFTMNGATSHKTTYFVVILPW